MNEMQIQSRLDVGKLFLGNMKLLAESKFSQIIIELKFIEKKEKVKLKLKPINGILLPKLFWPTVRKNCYSDWEKLLKFKAEGREFLRSLKQFIQTMKGQNNFW